VPYRMIYDYEIVLIKDGSLNVHYDNYSITLEENDLHIMKPFVWHSRSLDDGKLCNYYNIHFDFTVNNNDLTVDEYIDPINRRLSVVPINDKYYHRKIYEPSDIQLPEKLKLAEVRKAFSICEEMIGDFKNKPSGYELGVKLNMLKLYSLIYHQVTEKSGVVRHHVTLVREIETYLKTNFDKDINLETLAKQFSMSSSNLRRIFKKYNEENLIDYLTNARIEKAKELLSGSDMTVRQICYHCGFNEPHYFSAFFKRKTSYSPQQYRDLISKK
jgi:AraC-like DNA-binding protein